ncbi:MAG: hypothetical protein ACR2FM_00975 [Candidatus Saccharimonadales bacterium]
MKSKMRGYIKESEITDELQRMMEDASYHIKPGYSIDTETYPDNLVPFVESHLNYLKTHPQVDPMHYLANLRLMLKIR